MRYDALIIGTGQAGPPLARLLADEGKTVAVAEGGTFGGSCVNYGCTPSKAMIGSANAIHTARRGDDFGFRAGEIVVDYARIVERRDAIVKASRDGLIKSLEKRKNITLYRHYAAFEAPKRVRVGDDVIDADRVYINTGARPMIPAITGLDKTPHLDYIRLMALKQLPRHLVILGAGYIGLEFAQAFRRFGSDVTVIDNTEILLDHEDREFSEAIRDVLQGEGVRFIFNAETTCIAGHEGAVHLDIQHKDGSTQAVEGTHLLVATGRLPNSDKLGADKAGLTLDDEGYIQVDDHLQTSVEGVYALGDVNGRGAFTHTSYDDYLIIADNLNGGGKKVSDRIRIYAVFTDPPLARVGMSERDVRKSGRKALVAALPMDKVGRAKEFGQIEGMMKLLVDAETAQFLGATLFGMSADEAIHSIADLMYARAPYTVMKNAVHIHPTISELLPTMLQQLKPLE